MQEVFNTIRSIFNRAGTSSNDSTTGLPDEAAREFVRRTTVMTRAHLQILRSEGALKASEFDRIVRNHPRTICQDELKGGGIPQGLRTMEPTGSTRSFEEAHSEVAAFIATRLEPWPRTFERLNGLGVFSRINQLALVKNLLFATHFLRNQSLYGLLEENTAAQVEASYMRAYSSPSERDSPDTLDVLKYYQKLKADWLRALACGDPPQESIAAEVLRRCDVRSDPEPSGRYFVMQVLVADLVVQTAPFVWHQTLKLWKLTGREKTPGERTQESRQQVIRGKGREIVGITSNEIAGFAACVQDCDRPSFLTNVDDAKLAVLLAGSNRQICIGGLYFIMFLLDALTKGWQCAAPWYKLNDNTHMLSRLKVGWQVTETEARKLAELVEADWILASPESLDGIGKAEDKLRKNAVALIALCRDGAFEIVHLERQTTPT